MYKLIIELKEVGEYKTFPEAFREMYKRIKEIVKNGTALQTLETTNFIEAEINEEECPLTFYDCRDLAYAIGLMEDRKLNEGEIFFPPEVEQLVELAFVAGKVISDAYLFETMAKIKLLRESGVSDGGDNG